jgi:hypothetical protein
MNPISRTFMAHHPHYTTNNEKMQVCALLLSYLFFWGLFIFSSAAEYFTMMFFICGIKGQNDFSALRRRNVKKYLAILVWRARDKGAKGPFFCGWARSSLVFYFSTDRTAVNILFIMLHLRSIPRHIHIHVHVYVFLRPRSGVRCVMRALRPTDPIIVPRAQKCP